VVVVCQPAVCPIPEGYALRQQHRRGIFRRWTTRLPSATGMHIGSMASTRPGDTEASHRVRRLYESSAGRLHAHLRGFNRDGVWSRDRAGGADPRSAAWYQTALFRARIVSGRRSLSWRRWCRDARCICAAISRDLERQVVERTAELREPAATRADRYNDTLHCVPNRRMFTEEFVS